MSRYIGLILLLIIHHAGNTQPLISKEDAVQMAFNNQRNLKAATLSVQRQEQLLKGSAGIDNPQLFGQAGPYEPLAVGVQQTVSMPGVYRNRKVLQLERIRLAQLQLQGSQYDLKRETRLSYLQIQYLAGKKKLLYYQDSIYQALKISSKRFFEAGQINKLEELQATTQADRVRNELMRVQADFAAEMQIFRFYTGYADTFLVESIEVYAFVPKADTVVSNPQQQVLQQQIAISQKELQVERAELLPQIQASVSFPTTSEYERPVGYQLGITVPIWGRQNRSRIAAAKTSIEIARAQQELQQQRLTAEYRQALANYQRELQSLNYYNTTALPQANAIIETSQRLFGGGQLNYIESLRNLQSAFDIFINHLETHRSYNEAVIHLNYLNGTL